MDPSMNNNMTNQFWSHESNPNSQFTSTIPHQIAPPAHYGFHGNQWDSQPPQQNPQFTYQPCVDYNQQQFFPPPVYDPLPLPLQQPMDVDTFIPTPVPPTYQYTAPFQNHQVDLSTFRSFDVPQESQQFIEIDSSLASITSSPQPLVAQPPPQPTKRKPRGRQQRRERPTKPKKTRKRRRSSSRKGLPPSKSLRRSSDKEEFESDPLFITHFGKHKEVSASKIKHFLHMFDCHSGLPKQPEFEDYETKLYELAQVDPDEEGRITDPFIETYASYVSQVAVEKRTVKKTKSFIQMRQAVINRKLSSYFVRAAVQTSDFTHALCREADQANRLAFLLNLGWKSKKGNAATLIPFNTWKQEEFRRTVNQYTTFDAQDQWDMFTVAKQAFVSAQGMLGELEERLLDDDGDNHEHEDDASEIDDSLLNLDDVNEF